MLPVLEEDEEKLHWVDHLEELRRRLFVILGGLAAASVVSFFFSDAIFHFLIQPIRAFQEKLYFMAPYEAFLVKLKVSFFAGIILSAPVTFIQLWRFVAPGLYEKEKRQIAIATSWTVFCFFFGIIFAFFFVAPFALQFFLGFQTPDLRPLISVKEYISFFIGFLLAFGIAFVFPVFLLVLVRFGILQCSELTRQRRLAIVIIFIAAAILTPTTDVITQTLLAIPLIALFEISLLMAKRIERKRRT